MKKCPDDYLGRWFSVLYRLSISHICDGLKEFNIGSGQIMFLLELYHGDGISQGDLSSYLCINGANTTRAITKLEREGYVTRKPDEEDKRAYKIFLTDKGKEMKSHILELMSKWDEILLESLSSEEQATFNKLLKKIGHAVGDNQRCAICGLQCD